MFYNSKLSLVCQQTPQKCHNGHWSISHPNQVLVLSSKIALGAFYCVLLLYWSLGWKKRSEYGYYIGPLSQMRKNTKKDVGMAKHRLFQISEKPVLRLLSGVSAGTFKWQFLKKINLQLLQICHRASEMCGCLRSCCWHKPVTVICSAHKLALHISSVCGSAGSAQLPSSTQLDEVAHTANHGGDPHKDTILLGQQGICTTVRQNLCKGQNVHEKHAADGENMLVHTFGGHDKVAIAMFYSSACRKWGQH